MHAILNRFANRLWHDQHAASAVEYGIIASLFILAAIPALQELSGINAERRSAMHCAKRIIETAANGDSKRLKRIMSKRGACRRFI